LSHGHNDVTNALIIMLFSQTTEKIVFSVTVKRHI